MTTLVAVVVMVLAASAGGLASCSEAYAPPAIDNAEITVPDDLTLGRSTPVADPYYPDYGNPNIDVLHYGLDLTWSPDDQELAGVAVVTLRATRDNLNAVVLDFGRALNTTTVTVDGGAPRSVDHVGDDLTIGLSTPLSADEQVRLDIHYSGQPEPTGGPLLRETLGLGLVSFGDGRAYAFQEPFGAFTWFPANDHPSDEALYDARLTVPDGWSAVTSGNFIGQEVADGHAVFHWQSTEPIATYLIALAFDRYEMRQASGPHGISLSYWFPDDLDSPARAELDQIPGHISWLEERIGPYPFDSGGVVVVGVPIGMESQEMISLAPDVVTGPVLVHELAHMWFGDAVTPRTWQDVWLSEGFATYLQVLWESESTGRPLESHLEEWRLEDQQYRDDAGPPGQFDPQAALARNVYRPPALMLHEIRLRLGDEEFFAMLSAWASEHRHTTQDRASFTTWLNDRTGQDFSVLIADWLDSPTTPPTSF